MAKVIFDGNISKSALRKHGMCLSRTTSGYVLRSLPRRAKRPPTGQEIQARNIFAAATEYAKGINNDPKKKAAYATSLPAGATVFHSAVKEYYALFKKRLSSQKIPPAKQEKEVFVKRLTTRPDNKKLKDGRDRSKIDLNDPSEVEYFHSKHPQFSHAQIKAAIKKFGPVRKDVEAALRNKRLH